MPKLAIITTHPIQYNAPLFQYLAQQNKINLKVFYTLGNSDQRIYDPGFGIERTWDIDFLNGYNYQFVDNVSNNPASDHYGGVDNPTLISQISSFKPDAILVYGWNFKSHLKTLRYFKGKTPLLFRGDSTMLDYSNRWTLYKFLKLIFLKWVYSNVDYVLSPGKASDQYFRASGVKEQQIIRAPHAIDNNRFSGRSSYNNPAGNFDLNEENPIQTAITWRRDLGIPASHKVFLFAGKFESKKDPLLLIQAFKQLLQKRSDIHLIIVGDGILEEKIFKEIPNAQHPSVFTITLLPFQNQSVMPVVYRLCDVYVLPSKGPGETWGLSVNEAMSCGKPVIVSDKCGCAQELVKEGINGYTFKSGDLDDLTNKMQMILSKSNLEKMGQSSKEIVASFNYESFAIALDKCFRKLKL